MDSVFDSLFSVLPIVLGILWLLRSVKRGKKKRDEKAANPPPVVKRPVEEPLHFEEADNLESGIPAPAREPSPVVSGNTSALAREVAEDAAARAAEAQKKAAATVAAKIAQAMNAAREAGEAKAEKAAKAKRAAILAAGRQSPHEAPTGVRRSSSGKYSGAGSGSLDSDRRGESIGESTLSRIASLQPLAQGVLWAAILEKPLGLRDPADSLESGD